MNVDPRLLQQDVQEQHFAQQVAQLESAVKSVMTPEARSRLANVKLVSGERAVHAMLALAQLMQTGKASAIDDDLLKSVLASMPQRQVRFRK